jgi:hypothetical protein
MEEWEPVGGWNASFSEQDRIQSTNLFFFFQEAICGEGSVFAGDHDDFQAKISWSTVFGGSRGSSGESETAYSLGRSMRPSIVRKKSAVWTKRP